MKTYQIDVHSVLRAAVHGQTAEFNEWRFVCQLQGTRCAKVIRQAERLFPGRRIRARLIPRSPYVNKEGITLP